MAQSSEMQMRVLDGPFAGLKFSLTEAHALPQYGALEISQDGLVATYSRFQVNYPNHWMEVTWDG